MSWQQYQTHYLDHIKHICNNPSPKHHIWKDKPFIFDLHNRKVREFEWHQRSHAICPGWSSSIDLLHQIIALEPPKNKAMKVFLFFFIEMLWWFCSPALYSPEWLCILPSTSSFFPLSLGLSFEKEILSFFK